MLSWKRKKNFFEVKPYSTKSLPTIQKTLPPEKSKLLPQFQVDDYVIQVKKRNFVLGKVKQLDLKFSLTAQIESDFSLINVFVDDLPITLGQVDSVEVHELLELARALSKQISPTVLQLTDVYPNESGENWFSLAEAVDFVLAHCDPVILEKTDARVRQRPFLQYAVLVAITDHWDRFMCHDFVGNYCVLPARVATPLMNFRTLLDRPNELSLAMNTVKDILLDSRAHSRYWTAFFRGKGKNPVFGTQDEHDEDPEVTPLPSFRRRRMLPSVLNSPHLRDFKFFLSYVVSLRLRATLPRDLSARVCVPLGLFGTLNHLYKLAEDLKLFDGSIASFTPLVPESQSRPQQPTPPQKQSTPRSLVDSLTPANSTSTPSSLQPPQSPEIKREFPDRNLTRTHHTGLLDHQSLFALDGFGILHTPHDHHALRHSSKLCQSLNQSTAKSSPPVKQSADEKTGVHSFGLKVFGNDPDHALRVDMTQLRSYAIDDSSASEIDDAIAIERDASQPLTRVWLHVHVADPTSVISPNSVLDLDARRRATTVYLPHRRIMMLPKDISESLSLTGESNAITFSVKLDLTTGAIEDFKFCNSRIYVTRITYDEVDALTSHFQQATGQAKDLLARDKRIQDFLLLNRVSLARFRYRSENGGRNATPLSGVSLRVQPDGHISLSRESRQWGSRRIVEEAMILGGNVSARFAQENNVPISFRTLESEFFTDVTQVLNTSPSLDETNHLPIEPHIATVLQALQRIGFSASASQSPFPGKHVPLGLEQYSRVTSPLRRYADFLTHYQLKAFLRGGMNALPFSTEDLLQIIPRLHYTSLRANELQKQAEGYWRREYLLRLRSRQSIPSFMGIVVFCGMETRLGDLSKFSVRYHVPALSCNGVTTVAAGHHVREGDLIHLAPDPFSFMANLVPVFQLSADNAEKLLPPEPFADFVIPEIDFEREFAWNDAALTSILGIKE